MRGTRFSLTAAALLFAVTVSSVPEARADEVSRVAVVVSLSVNADTEQTARLAGALAQVLEREFLVKAIGGSAVDEKLVDGVPDDCIANAECVRTLAKTLDVEQMLLLTIVRVGERFKVSVTWGDGSDGRTLSRVTIDIDVEQQDPGPVFAVYATRLLPDATPRPDEPDPKKGNDGGQAGDGKTGDNGKMGDGQSDTGKTSPAVGFRPQSRHMTTGSWVAAGAGATLLVAGIGFGLAARGTYGELDTSGCAGACAEADLDKLAFQTTAADVLFGAALVSGVTAALLYWRSGGRISVGGGAELATYATDREIGVVLGGRF